MDWKEFWNHFPGRFENEDFLMQVGKTVQGKPISEEQFRLLVLDLIQKLELAREDQVLDLCCGNGLVTAAIADQCRHVVGVDFSGPLIDVARQFHNRANIEYFNLSVLDASLERLNMCEPFTRIYMYEGLQYFDEEQLAPLLETLVALVGEEGILLLAGIPDRAHLWEFYDTPQRQRDYELRKQQGTEAIGTWWERSEIEQAGNRFGLRCEFLEQPASSHTAHYRFDVRMQKR